MDSDNLVQQIESVMDFSRNSVLWDINQSIKYQTEQINQTYFTQQSMCQSNLNNWCGIHGCRVTRVLREAADRLEELQQENDALFRAAMDNRKESGLTDD